MSTESAPLPSWRTDSPWSRLRWTLPAAVLISAAVLWALAYFMERPAPEQMPPTPIEAQFLEQPAPQRVEVAPPIVHPPKPAPPARRQPPRNERLEQKTPVQKPQAAPSAPIELPAAPSEEQAKTGIDQAGTISAPASSGGGQGASGPAFGGNGDQGGSGGGKGTQGGSMYASIGARAIIRPMPQIPDDLRDEAFNFTALARFRIAVDGTAEVELAKATPNPRLNRILLDSLRKWLFMPAIKNGKPVASTEEIVVKLEVK